MRGKVKARTSCPPHQRRGGSGEGQAHSLAWNAYFERNPGQLIDVQTRTFDKAKECTSDYLKSLPQVLLAELYIAHLPRLRAQGDTCAVGLIDESLAEISVKKPSEILDQLYALDIACATFGYMTRLPPHLQHRVTQPTHDHALFRLFWMFVFDVYEVMLLLQTQELEAALHALQGLPPDIAEKVVENFLKNRTFSCNVKEILDGLLPQKAGGSGKHKRVALRRVLVAEEVREIVNSSSPAHPFVAVDNCNRPPQNNSKQPTAPGGVVIKPTPEEERAHSEAVALHNSFKSGAGYLTKVPYPPFSKLAQLRNLRRTGACVDRARHPALLFAETPGSKRYVNAMGYDIFELPEGTLMFKGTRYFYDAVGDQPFVWVGNELTAMTYANRYFGGCMVYRAVKKVRLLLLSKRNCERLHRSTPWSAPPSLLPHSNADNHRVPYLAETFEPLSPHTKYAFELKFGVGISAREQAKRIRAYHLIPDGEPMYVYRTRDIGRFTYCATPDGSRLFGAGLNDRYVAAFLHARKDAVGGVDGWLSTESFSPYHCALSEEVLLFPGTNRVRVDTKHPLAWQQWLPLVSPRVQLPAAPFDLSNAYFGVNQNFSVLSAVCRHQGSDLTRAVLKLAAAAAAAAKRATTKGKARARAAPRTADSPLRVLAWNVHGFQSPNATTSAEEACDRCVRLAEVRDPDLVILQSVPEDLSSRAASGFASIGYRVAGSAAASDGGDVLMCLLREDGVLSMSGRCAAVASPSSSSTSPPPPSYRAMSVPLAWGKMTTTLLACAVPSGEAPVWNPLDGSPLPIAEYIRARRTNAAALASHLQSLLRAFPSACCVLGCFNGRIDHLRPLLPKGARIEPPPGVQTTISAYARSRDQYVLLGRDGAPPPEARCEPLPFVQSLHYPVEVELRRVWAQAPAPQKKKKAVAKKTVMKKKGHQKA